MKELRIQLDLVLTAEISGEEVTIDGGQLEVDGHRDCWVIDNDTLGEIVAAMASTERGQALFGFALEHARDDEDALQGAMARGLD